MKIRLLAASLFLLLLSSFATAGDRAPQLVVFGDSLGDMGNLYRFTDLLGLEPAIPPSDGDYEVYWEGRFSNGPIWAEYLASQLPIDGELQASIDARAWQAPVGINFAWGGATTKVSNPTPAGLPVPGLLGQIDLYKLRFHRVNGTAPDTLFAIWVGADDFLLDPTVAVDPKEVAKNVIKGVRKLRRLGAREILVANLPELCGLPVTVELGLAGCPTPQEPGETPAQRFNATLASKLQTLAYKWPDTSIYLVDIYAAQADVFGSAFPEQFNGPAAGCLLSLPDPDLDPELCRFDVRDISPSEDLGPGAVVTVPVPGAGGALLPLLFWDEQHPTTLVHNIISGVMLETLANDPLPNM